MFQTDIIFFLQSFESPLLTILMKIITSLGNKEFFFIIIIAIMSGIDFRKGFILTQVLIMTGLITELCKEMFALPRPWFVDKSISTFGKELVTNFIDSGADSFFGVLPENVVKVYRQLKPEGFGLPSGHTSSAVALWGTLIILFRNNIVKVISGTLIILVPMSRLYLARHFLADILAGYPLFCLDDYS